LPYSLIARKLRAILNSDHYAKARPFSAASLSTNTAAS